LSRAWSGSCKGDNSECGVCLKKKPAPAHRSRIHFPLCVKKAGRPTGVSLRPCLLMYHHPLACFQGMTMGVSVVHCIYFHVIATDVNFQDRGVQRMFVCNRYSLSCIVHMQWDKM
jgi:hypothetical protein